jgi:hypothetical protein
VELLAEVVRCPIFDQSETKSIFAAESPFEMLELMAMMFPEYMVAYMATQSKASVFQLVVVVAFSPTGLTERLQKSA